MEFISMRAIEQIEAMIMDRYEADELWIKFSTSTGSPKPLREIVNIADLTLCHIHTNGESIRESAIARTTISKGFTGESPDKKYVNNKSGIKVKKLDKYLTESREENARLEKKELLEVLKNSPLPPSEPDFCDQNQVEQKPDRL